VSEQRESKPSVVGRASGWGTRAQIVRQLGIALVVVLIWGLLWMVLNFSGGARQVAEVKPGPSPTWDEHIRPVLQRHCALCHGSSGALSLASYEQALRGGAHGPAFVPGSAEGSLLYRVLVGSVNSIPRMPFGQAPLPPETIALIQDWINQLPPVKR